MLQLPQTLGSSEGILSNPQAREIQRTLAQQWFQYVFVCFCIYSLFLVLSGGSMSSTETLAQSLAQQMLIKQQVDLLLKVIKLFQNYFIWALLQMNTKYCMWYATLRSASNLSNIVNFAKWRKACVGAPNVPVWSSQNCESGELFISRNCSNVFCNVSLSHSLYLVSQNWAYDHISAIYRWTSLDQIWVGSSSVAQSQWTVNAR